MNFYTGSFEVQRDGKSFC